MEELEITIKEELDVRLDLIYAKQEELKSAIDNLVSFLEVAREMNVNYTSDPTEISMELLKLQIRIEEMRSKLTMLEGMKVESREK